MHVPVSLHFYPKALFASCHTQNGNLALMSFEEIMRLSSIICSWYGKYSQELGCLQKFLVADAFAGWHSGLLLWVIFSRNSIKVRFFGKLHCQVFTSSKASHVNFRCQKAELTIASQYFILLIHILQVRLVLTVPSHCLVKTCNEEINQRLEHKTIKSWLVVLVNYSMFKHTSHI